MISKGSVVWKGTRKDGVVSKGVQRVSGQEVDWLINKSAGGLCYCLHFGTVGKVPMVTRSTIIECKQYAEDYF